MSIPQNLTQVVYRAIILHHALLSYDVIATSKLTLSNVITTIQSFSSSVASHEFLQSYVIQFSDFEVSECSRKRRHEDITFYSKCSDSYLAALARRILSQFRLGGSGTE